MRTQNRVLNNSNNVLINNVGVVTIINYKNLCQTKQRGTCVVWRKISVINYLQTERNTER